MPRKGCKDSCGPPECVGQKFALSIVMAKEVRAKGDAESLVEMLMDHDAALGKRDSEMRRLDLQDEALEGDGVVVTGGAFLFDGENQIKIDVGPNRNKSGSLLLGFDSKSLVKLVGVNFFQETIGSVFGFDTVETEFVGKSALKSFVDAFAAASRLRGISRNGPDAQFCEGAADLSEMSLQDLAAGFGSEKEMAGSVRIQGAIDAVRGDTIFEQSHAA